MRTVNFLPGEALRWLHRRRGPVVRLPPAPVPVTYLFGAQANAFVFAHDDLFRWREAFKGLIPVDGDTALVVSDGPDHSRRRALVRPALAHRQVTGYLPIMTDAAAEALQTITPGATFDAYALFRAVIRRSTLRSLFGEQIAEREDTIATLLQPLFDLTDHIQTIGLRERMNSPMWRRAMLAREQLDRWIYPEITRTREAPPDKRDGPMLTMLVHGPDGTGSGLSDPEIRDQVVSLIAAGYETTSAAMAWTLYALASRTDLMAQARQQVRSVCTVGSVTTADLPGLSLITAIVAESLRLYPPAVISARWAAVGFDVAGRTVRPGTIVIVSPYVTHRDPDLYPRPREFRPERWIGTPRRPSSEYLPFGGGAHRCAGSVMATTELTVLLAQLLRRGGYTITDRRVAATSLAAMRPRHGLHLRLE